MIELILGRSVIIREKNGDQNISTNPKMGLIKAKAQAGETNGDRLISTNQMTGFKTVTVEVTNQKIHLEVRAEVIRRDLNSLANQITCLKAKIRVEVN